MRKHKLRNLLLCTCVGHLCKWIVKQSLVYKRPKTLQCLLSTSTASKQHIFSFKSILTAEWLKTDSSEWESWNICCVYLDVHVRARSNTCLCHAWLVNPTAFTSCVKMLEMHNIICKYPFHPYLTPIICWLSMLSYFKANIFWMHIRANKKHACAY